MALNLLGHRIVDILFEEGGRFALSKEEGGRERVERLFVEALAARGVAPATLSVAELRVFYHQGFAELLEAAVPGDTRDRVTDRFFKLVFR